MSAVVQALRMLRQRCADIKGDPQALADVRWGFRRLRESGVPLPRGRERTLLDLENQADKAAQSKDAAEIQALVDSVKAFCRDELRQAPDDDEENEEEVESMGRFRDEDNDMEEGFTCAACGHVNPRADQEGDEVEARRGGADRAMGLPGADDEDEEGAAAVDRLFDGKTQWECQHCGKTNEAAPLAGARTIPCAKCGADNLVHEVWGKIRENRERKECTRIVFQHANHPRLREAGHFGSRHTAPRDAVALWRKMERDDFWYGGGHSL